MINENAQKLINALASGTYKQGRSCLHHKPTNAYCVMGVACDIYQKEVGDLDTSTPLGGHPDFTYYDSSRALVPKKVQDWLHLSTKEGAFLTDKGIVRTLIDLNDDKPYASFTKIAKIIASNPQWLFDSDITYPDCILLKNRKAQQ